MSYKGVPTVRKRLLGGQLRRIREARGVSVDDVANRLGMSVPAVRRQESGHTATSVADVMAYAKIYELDDLELQKRLTELAKHGRVRGWWTAYGSTVGPTAVDVADAEDLATEIRTFQPLVIPGIFQTRDYSSTVIDVGIGLRPEENSPSVEDLLTLRERRKRILEGDNPPQVYAIIGEAAVLTKVGGPKVMHEQLNHLVTLGERRNIHIQMLPFSAGAHVGMSGAFVVLSFGDTLDGSITYLEKGGLDSFNDDPVEVRVSATRFTHLQAQALSVTDTRTYLQQAISAD
ncbi:helix-turn-helix transcriptional regulator [Streptomyces sp. W16]|uniref:helix-turn-helix domain-containing protein n=1 Tax=Streptomyces sp. W16 TaxID=3076631 RepID=UPI00295B61F9|nr:helix-turn-helix transcriptional regulator [Streptomyces sp. W16]MDV9169830.1 helix-turn-helix transcriptional regulator [Streptomyces sp. W16]